MDNVLATGINAFSVQASRDRLITVPVSLLQDLQDMINILEDRIIRQDEKIAALEATQDTQAENQLIQLRLINDLRKKEPGRIEHSRAAKIEKYLETRPDHKATFETLKGHLGIGNDQLNRAVKVLLKSDKHAYAIRKAREGDKRSKTLLMVPEV